jgi:16S rRNA (guanine966-N2)-methyltransferase
MTSSSSKTKKHAVRIIGGQWKRTPLPVADVPGLRPTPDRVRETLFNWLYTLRGGMQGMRCLDLFAGTGALGFEAASRGAGEVFMIEQNRALAAQLSASKAKLKAEMVQIRTGDAVNQIGALTGKFDCVFLDPPYDARLLPRVLPLLAPLLSEEALVYVEDHGPLQFEGWTVVRQDKAGQVHYGLLQRAKATDFSG